MNSNRLIKKSGLYLIGNLSSKLMTTILIPIYAFYISAEDLGFYDFSQTIMGILSPIIIVALWEAVLKFILSEEDNRIKQKIISTSAIFTITMSLGFIIIAFLYNMLSTRNIRYYSLIVAMIVLQIIVNVWQYYARATYNNKLYVTAGIISTFINFICVLFFVVYLRLGLFGLIMAFNLGQISIIIIIELKLKVFKNFKIRDFDNLILKRMVIFSSPLVLNLISAWFISGFGRMIITFKLGTEANGLYSFANKFSLAITMIGNVITMAIIEEAILSINSKKANNDFNKTLQKLFLIFQTISVLAVPAIVIFYKFIGDTEYFGSLSFAPWFLIYSVSNTMASNIGSVFQAIEKTRYQFTTTIVGGLVTFVVSWFLIDIIGISAVIIGQILGATTMLVTRYILINRFTQIKLNWSPIFVMLLIFIGTTLITINASYLVSIYIEIFIIGILVFKNRSMLLKGYKTITNRGVNSEYKK